VPFFDLDPMQIVWHANYLNYFEVARAALFENNGIDLYSFFERDHLIFPIIKTSTKHILPLRHRDEIICKATLLDTYVKIIVDFEIRRADDGKVCARGRTEQVTVKVPNGNHIQRSGRNPQSVWLFMMENILQKSFIAGLERLNARAELLDSINVFPIADGDTGRNLAISLVPLRNVGQPKETIIHQLLLSARGNSGNIASQFFSVFCAAESITDLAECARAGKIKAWQAISHPRTGTMLSVFDALADVLPRNLNTDRASVEKIIGSLEETVRETCEQLPRLQEAGVVDAGALGIYIFFEGFFYTLAGNS
jgi:YbgC/YbaW family acyl-CoA thioester hydrolase